MFPFSRITKTTVLFFSFFTLFLGLTPSVVSAQDFIFNPNNIISDFELKDKNAMSFSAIQAFLNKYDSVLKNYTETVNGVVKTSAEIIYEASQTHIISPKFIVAKLDHEQCLIRGCEFLKDPVKLQKALDWATGFAVCSGCNLNDPKIQKYKGFANQVDALASVQNDYIRKAGTAPYLYAKGQTFTTKDGYTVTPQTQATANLFIYTPYHGGPNGIGGNYFFAKLWERYWGNLVYPDGTVFLDSRGAYWLVDGGTRRKYANESVYFSSHVKDDALVVSDAVLQEYAEGAEIKFANYSIMQDEAGDRYLLVDSRKRKISDEETFRQLGFNPEEVIHVSSAELFSYKTTVPITLQTVYPQGVLMKEEGTNNVYWVQNGFKYRVFDDVAEVNYPNTTPILKTHDELARYYSGDAQKVKDGKLVKSQDGTIYMISHGALRAVQSVADFIALFGEARLTSVIELSSESLALHSVGDVLAASIYDRASDSPSSQIAGDKTTPPMEYKALWIDAHIPPTLLAGQLTPFTITFKNKSTVTWNPGDVLVKVEETGENFANTDVVPSNTNYTFAFSYTTHNDLLKTLTSKMYTKSGVYVKGGFFQTSVKVVQPLYQAEVVSSTVPPAVKNDWSQVQLEVVVKNTGSRAWTRRKTGLLFLSENGGESPFYDAKDWVNTKTASVSLSPNKTSIAPGETSVFRFTIKPRGLTPGMYRYRIMLLMTDNTEKLYLNKSEFIIREIRVDD